jgi:sulfate adenylyltransferase subunit 2
MEALFGLDSPQVWDTALAYRQLQLVGQADSKRTAERRLHELGVLPIELHEKLLLDEHGRKPLALVLDAQIERARGQRRLVLFAQLHAFSGGQVALHANDARGRRYWVPLGTAEARPADVRKSLGLLQIHIGKDLAVFPHLGLAGLCRLEGGVSFVSLLAYPKKLDLTQQEPPPESVKPTPFHLRRLEDESIYILREAIATAEKPVLLYSMGKGSNVLLHLARKAFYPNVPPLPLLHIDTHWHFREMYEYRDQIVQSTGVELLVHPNPAAISQGINPLEHGSALHSDVTEAQGLEQALSLHRFDVVLSGARRDEETCQAEEGIFSLRSEQHRFIPEKQRPEFWSLYNTLKRPGETLRVAPLSNWTELDIWQYTLQENIPILPLYLAMERPVVAREGIYVLVDDDRMRLQAGEQIQKSKFINS